MLLFSIDLSLSASEILIAVASTVTTNISGSEYQATGGIGNYNFSYITTFLSILIAAIAIIVTILTSNSNNNLDLSGFRFKFNLKKRYLTFLYKALRFLDFIFFFREIGHEVKDRGKKVYSLSLWFSIFIASVYPTCLLFFSWLLTTEDIDKISGLEIFDSSISFWFRILLVLVAITAIFIVVKYNFSKLKVTFGSLIEPLRKDRHRKYVRFFISAFAAFLLFSFVLQFITLNASHAESSYLGCFLLIALVVTIVIGAISGFAVIGEIPTSVILLIYAINLSIGFAVSYRLLQQDIHAFIPAVGLSVTTITFFLFFKSKKTTSFALLSLFLFLPLISIYTYKESIGITFLLYVFFIGILPILNGVFDWFSALCSRAFSYEILINSIPLQLKNVNLNLNSFKQPLSLWDNFQREFIKIQKILFFKNIDVDMLNANFREETFTHNYKLRQFLLSEIRIHCDIKYKKLKELLKKLVSCKPWLSQSQIEQEIKDFANNKLNASDKKYLDFLVKHKGLDVLEAINFQEKTKAFLTGNDSLESRIKKHTESVLEDFLNHSDVQNFLQEPVVENYLQSCMVKNCIQLHIGNKQSNQSGKTKTLNKLTKASKTRLIEAFIKKQNQVKNISQLDFIKDLRHLHITKAFLQDNTVKKFFNTDVIQNFVELDIMESFFKLADTQQFLEKNQKYKKELFNWYLNDYVRMDIPHLLMLLIMDFFIALVTMIFVSACIFLGMKFINVFWLSLGETDSNIQLPAQNLLDTFKNNPFNLEKGLWITCMLFSTSLPTIIHFCLASLGLLVSTYRFFDKPKNQDLHFLSQSFGAGLIILIIIIFINIISTFLPDFFAVIKGFIYEFVNSLLNDKFIQDLLEKLAQVIVLVLNKILEIYSELLELILNL